MAERSLRLYTLKQGCSSSQLIALEGSNSNQIRLIRFQIQSRALTTLSAFEQALRHIDNTFIVRCA
jgi:hypothetical protein